MDLYILVHNSWHGSYPFEDSFCEHLFIGLDKEACLAYVEAEGYENCEVQIEHWVIDLKMRKVEYKSREDI